jgi:FkbM family methyltransferase
MMQVAAGLTNFTRLRIATASAIGHAHLLPFSIRDRAVRLLASPEFCPGTLFTVDFFGQRYSGQLDSFIDWSVFMFGAYEEAVAKLMVKVVREGFSAPPVVWDIGANCGHHTLLLAPYAKEVHAFEPLESLCDSIQQKIQENNLRNVKIHRLGLGDEITMRPFGVPTDRNWGSGVFYPDGMLPPNDAATIDLPLSTGDALVATGTSVPQFLKMDVQEFEYQALVGMHDTVRTSRPIIVLEYGRLLQERTSGMRRTRELLGMDYAWYLIKLAVGGFKLKPLEDLSQFSARPFTFVDIIGIPQERAQRLSKVLSVASNETPGER